MLQTLNNLQVHEWVKLGKDHLKRKRFFSKEMLALDTDILKSISNLELNLKLKPLLDLDKRFEKNALSYK